MSSPSRNAASLALALLVSCHKSPDHDVPVTTATVAAPPPTHQTPPTTLPAGPAWHWVNPLPQGNALWAVVANAPCGVVAVGAASTVMRSTDDGLTWVTHQADDRHRFKGAALSGTDLYTVGDSDDGAVVVEMADCGSGAPTTIRKLDQKVDGAANGVAVDGDGRLYVTTVLHAEGRILCTKEKGSSLEVCDDQPGTPFYGLFIDKSGRVFVAGGYDGKLGGILRSSADHGATWKNVGEHLGSIAYGVWGDPEGNRLLVSTPGELYTRPASGGPWTASPAPLMMGGSMALGTGDAPYVPNDFSVSLHGGSSSGTFFFVANGGVLRGEGYGPKLEGFAVADGAARFQAATTTGNGHWIGVGDSGTITRSVDDGKHWTRISKDDLPGDGALLDLFVQGSTIYLLRESMLLRSDDGAKTFVALGKEEPRTDYPNLTRDYVTLAADASVVLLPRAVHGAIARSTDHGATFTEVPLRLSAGQRALHVSPGDPGTFFVSGTAGTLLRTRDEGVTFAPLRIQTKDDLASVAVSQHDLYVTGTSTSVYAGGDIFHSRDDGDTWTSVAIANFDPYGIAVAGPDVYAINRYGTFMRSIDHAATWKKTRDLACGDVQGLVVQAGKISVACGSGRVYTSSDRGTTFTMKRMLADLELLFSDGHDGLFAASSRGWSELLHEY